jgi:mRNA interferase MazF
MITRTIHRAGRVDTQVLVDVAAPEGKTSGLKATSAINCSSLFTVSEHLLHRKIGELPQAVMAKVNACLKAALGIP